MSHLSVKALNSLFVFIFKVSNCTIEMSEVDVRPAGVRGARMLRLSERISSEASAPEEVGAVASAENEESAM